MESKNIIYLRVSKEDKDLQDPATQKKAILEKFEISDYTIYEERGSAYDLNKFYKRKKFIEIISLAFDSEQTTISDLFLRDFARKSINLYVWDYARIMRNFEYNLLFGLLADFFNITIYSFKDGRINKKEQETPTEKLARYMLYAISAFGAEDYSFQTSKNIKKAVYKEEGITVNKEGIKWGRSFTNIEGNKVHVAASNIKLMNLRIKALDRYYKKKGLSSYYNQIITKISKEWGIKISKSYISSLKNKD